MPVRVESDPALSHRAQSENGHTRQAALPDSCITVGLVNNMPPAAFRATERQFSALLRSAAEDLSVRLLLYTLPGTSAAEASEHAGARYASVETLWNSGESAGEAHQASNGAAYNKATHEPFLDGLIVTGAEPIQPDLRDEPYWSSFTRLLDWAQVNTYSTVWSCLAAHAAILHMDGINRRRRATKLSGIYPCQRVRQHRLLQGSASSFPVPHSRWNGVAEADLDAHGYQVLARSSDSEVDTFVRDQQSLFVFFQGHPEYESDTLLREYRRDAGRFLRHEAASYPSLPHAYFDRELEPALNEVRNTAIDARSQRAPGHHSQHALETALEHARIENTWHGPAAKLYRNWLIYLCERKSAAQSPAARPESSKLEPTRPDFKKPGSTKLESAQPETAEPAGPASAG